MRNRSEIPFLLSALRLEGEGAEIGVQFGVYSATLLYHWKGRRLYSIDSWREFDPAVYRDRSNQTQEVHDRFYADTCRRLGVFGERSAIVRSTSAEAAPRFRDGQLDFVYIDAQHHYEAVVEDLALWRPKVRPGGLLSGHDYMDGETEHERFGVKSAVDELARCEGRRVIRTREKMSPSWIIRL